MRRPSLDRSFQVLRSRSGDGLERPEEALGRKDPIILEKASEMYASLEIPFEEARCRGQTQAEL
jgi:hypothetical protein